MLSFCMEMNEECKTLASTNLTKNFLHIEKTIRWLKVSRAMGKERMVRRGKCITQRKRMVQTRTMGRPKGYVGECARSVNALCVGMEKIGLTAIKILGPNIFGRINMKFRSRCS